MQSTFPHQFPPGGNKWQRVSIPAMPGGISAVMRDAILISFLEKQQKGCPQKCKGIDIMIREHHSWIPGFREPGLQDLGESNEVTYYGQGIEFFIALYLE